MPAKTEVQDPLQRLKKSLLAAAERPLLPPEAKLLMLQAATTLDVLAHRQNELAYMVLQLKASSSTYIDADLQAAWRDRLVTAGFPNV